MKCKKKSENTRLNKETMEQEEVAQPAWDMMRTTGFSSNACWCGICHGSNFTGTKLGLPRLARSEGTKRDQTMWPSPVCKASTFPAFVTTIRSFRTPLWSRVSLVLSAWFNLTCLTASASSWLARSSVTFTFKIWPCKFMWMRKNILRTLVVYIWAWLKKF